MPEIRSMVETMPDGPHWPEEAWAALAEAMPSAGQQRISLVVRDSAEKLIGWVTGTALGEIADLEFLLVALNWRRAGVGRSLLDAWLDVVKETGVTEIFLEVRASNHTAIRLYRTAGFVPKGVRRRYYSRPVEDAVVMRMPQ